MSEAWKDALKGLEVDLEGLCPEDVEEVKKAVCQIKQIIPHADGEKETIKLIVEGVLEAARERGDLHGGDVAFHEISGDAIEELEDVFGASKKDGTDFVNIQRIQFKRTKSPLYVWSALAVVLDQSQLPDWMKSYFREVCQNLIRLPLEVSGENDLDGADFYLKALSALGFDGKPAFYEQVDWMSGADIQWCLEEVQEKRRRGEIEFPKGIQGKPKSSKIVGSVIGKGHRTVEYKAKKSREARGYVDNAIKSDRKTDGDGDNE